MKKHLFPPSPSIGGGVSSFKVAREIRAKVGKRGGKE